MREELSCDGESHYIVLFSCFVLLVSFCYSRRPWIVQRHFSGLT